MSISARVNNLQRSRDTFVDPKAILAIYMMHHWHLKNVQRPRLRISILLMFWFGLALVGIPAVITFAQVTMILFRMAPL